MALARPLIWFFLLAICFPDSSYAGNLKVLHAFTGGADGQSPEAGLTADANGNLLGTTCGACQGSAPGKHCSKSCGNNYALLQGGGEVTLYSFKGGRDGANPTAPLLRVNHHFFGTTGAGGNQCDFGCGTIFRLQSDGSEKVIYRFCGAPKDGTCPDGSSPASGVIADNLGNLYGTTVAGGAANLGTIYKLSSDRTETVLYSFCQLTACVDGALPHSALIADDSGNLFGTTFLGGASEGGAIFELTKDGSYKILHSFAGGDDGSNPLAGLVADASGNFYGTTTAGGANGLGTVYRLSPDNTETVLYSFAGGNDGQFPQGELVADKATNLYGTTNEGGGNACSGYGCGVVFEVTAQGQETILHRFCSKRHCADGSHPTSRLLIVKKSLFGTTEGGGSGSCGDKNGCGVIFQLKIK